MMVGMANMIIGRVSIMIDVAVGVVNTKIGKVNMMIEAVEEMTKGPIVLGIPLFKGVAMMTVMIPTHLEITMRTITAHTVEACMTIVHGIMLHPLSWIHIRVTMTTVIIITQVNGTIGITMKEDGDMGGATKTHDIFTTIRDMIIGSTPLITILMLAVTNHIHRRDLEVPQEINIQGKRSRLITVNVVNPKVKVLMIKGWI